MTVIYLFNELLLKVGRVPSTMLECVSLLRHNSKTTSDVFLTVIFLRKLWESSSEDDVASLQAELTKAWSVDMT